MKKIIKLCTITFLFLFSIVPLFATNDEYVRDDYGVITEEEAQELDALARKYSEVDDVGIYIRVVPNTGNANSLLEYAENLYYEEGLGDKTDGNMILLIINMDKREYQYVAHGDKSNAAFTDYGKVLLDDYVLVNLRNDNYYEAFNQFIIQCDRYLDEYEEGTPIDVPTPSNSTITPEEASKGFRTGVTFGLPPIAALITCLRLKARNTNVRRATDADDFIPMNGININVQQDNYIRTSRIVTHNPKPRDMDGPSGGTTVDAGGFSSHGGNF